MDDYVFLLTTKNRYRAAVVANNQHEARLIAFSACKDGWWYAGDAERLTKCDSPQRHRPLAVERLDTA
jgi:hypothetical protein